MISRKMLRRAAFRLADALEAAAGALRERAEYRGRRRPFAFPTASDLMMEAISREAFRCCAAEFDFTSPGLWDGSTMIRVMDEGGEIKFNRIKPGDGLEPYRELGRAYAERMGRECIERAKREPTPPRPSLGSG